MSYTPNKNGLVGNNIEYNCLNDNWYINDFWKLDIFFFKC